MWGFILCFVGKGMFWFLPLVVGWFPLLSGESICNSKLWILQGLNENLRCLPFQPSRSLTIKSISLPGSSSILDQQFQPPAVVSSMGPEGLTYSRTIQRSTQYLRGVYTHTLLLPSSSRIFPLHLQLFCQSQTSQVKNTAF